MQDKHMMPDGHMMPDKEMEGMEKKMAKKKKTKGGSYSKEVVAMARKMMG